MRLFMLSVACLAVPNFCALSHIRYDIGGEKMLYNKSFILRKLSEILKMETCIEHEMYHSQGGRKWGSGPGEK